MSEKRQASSRRRRSHDYVTTDASLQTVKRSDKVVDETPQQGNLVSVKTPKMLTLVGLPANQTAFKVLRSDTESPGESKMSTLIRRTRRSTETNPVMRLVFPEGNTQETVEAALKSYGMAGYTVEEQDGVFTATRADVKSISKEATQDIPLNSEGLVATVARAETKNEEKAKLVMTSIEFDSTKFTLEEVQRWSTEKGVDGTVQEPQNSDECYVVRRSEVPESEETRRMELEDGVTAVIIRSDVANIPDNYVAVVSEAAYGSWGWGQLDFMAALSDSAFSEAMRTSISMLEDVLRNIVVYSSLPLDVRKDLANRALAQFGEYIGTVLDSLPRQLLVSVVRSANPQQESLMSKAESGAANTNAAAKEEAKEAPVTAKETDTLNRADVQTMIDTAVAAALRAAAAPKEEEKPAEPAAPITRADVAAAMAEAMKPLNERLEALAGTTVVRSGTVETTPKAGEKVEQDVFRGAIPGLRRKAA